MRRLVVIVLAAGLAYAGYWLVGSRAVQSGAEQALSALKAEGRGDYAAVELHGFPSRFDVTVTEPRLVSADGRLSWAAPFIQILALSYRPNHVIAVWPHEQRLTIGGEAITVASADMRASAAFGASTLLPVDHAEGVARQVSLTDSGGGGLVLAEARLAIRQAAPVAAAAAAEPAGGATGANRYDIAAEGLGMQPTGAAADLGAVAAGDPAATGWFRLQTTAGFDRPLDRAALEGALRMTGLTVGSLRASYGQLEIDGAGGFTIAGDGRPEGAVQLQVKGWQGLPEVLVRAGLITPEVAPTVMKVLVALSLSGGGADGAVRLPLAARGGHLFLGPVPLGPAPRL